MSAKKIVILVPDGLGLRNFAYTDFYKQAQSRGHDVVFWHLTPFDVSAMGYREIRIESPRMHIWTNILKILRIRYDIFSNIRRTRDEIYKCYLFKLPYRTFRESVKNLVVESYLFFMGPKRGIRKVRRMIVEKESSTPYYQECLETLKREKPDVVFCTNQRTVYAIAPILAAQSMGIPTATFIFSWDNLPKATMALEPDYYLVWSDYMSKELQFYYPYIQENQVFVTGTPQFEPHTYSHLLKDRETFCRENKLDPDRRYVCFSGDDITTSPHDEQYLRDLASAVRKMNADGANLGIVFRRCPVDFSGRYEAVLADYADVVTPLDPKWEQMANRWNGVLPTPADLELLVNTIAHTEAVVNLGSSMVFDYASFSKPCVFVAYDGGPVSRCRSVDTIYKYVHFRSMPSKDAVFWVHQPSDFEVVLHQALTHPGPVVAEARKWFGIVNLQPANMASSRVLDALENIMKR